MYTCTAGRVGAGYSTQQSHCLIHKQLERASFLHGLLAMADGIPALQVPKAITKLSIKWSRAYMLNKGYFCCMLQQYWSFSSW